MRPATNSEVKLLNLNSRPFVKDQLKDQTDGSENCLGSLGGFSGLSSDQFRSVFEFFKDSSKCLNKPSSFQELRNDMTHVLKRPCSGREECRKVSPSRPRL